MLVVEDVIATISCDMSLEKVRSDARHPMLAWLGIDPVRRGGRGARQIEVFTRDIIVTDEISGGLPALGDFKLLDFVNLEYGPARRRRTDRPCEGRALT